MRRCLSLAAIAVCMVGVLSAEEWSVPLTDKQKQSLTAARRKVQEANSDAESKLARQQFDMAVQSVALDDGIYPTVSICDLETRTRTRLTVRIRDRREIVIAVVKESCRQ